MLWSSHLAANSFCQSIMYFTLLQHLGGGVIMSVGVTNNNTVSLPPRLFVYDLSVTFQSLWNKRYNKNRGLGNWPPQKQNITWLKVWRLTPANENFKVNKLNTAESKSKILTAILNLCTFLDLRYKNSKIVSKNFTKIFQS